jgi:hypothetical protein
MAHRRLVRAGCGIALSPGDVRLVTGPSSRLRNRSRWPHRAFVTASAFAALYQRAPRAHAAASGCARTSKKAGRTGAAATPGAPHRLLRAYFPNSLRDEPGCGARNSVTARTKRTPPTKAGRDQRRLALRPTPGPARESNRPLSRSGLSAPERSGSGHFPQAARGARVRP